ncbi:MAG: radical SAM protein, partial [bacterium]|nr:radical SAM protein [bacterium]
GIKTTTYWVVGHPGETEEDFQATLDLIAELKDDIYQSEPNPFLYYYSTQTNSLKWAGRRKLLFPEEMQDMLVFKTWTLDIEPVREEVYRRLFRFTQHCKKLGIPNPYTLGEYIEADERWKKLHKNAAPSTMDFLSRKPIYENKDIKNSTLAKKIRRNRAVFDF